MVRSKLALFLIPAVLAAQSATGVPSSGASIPLSLPPSGSAGGVLSGTYPNPAVASTATTGNPILSVCHAQYSFATDGGGAPGLITPSNNCTIPANSTIYNVSIRWTTAGVGATNTTSIGVTGTGGGAAALLGATAVASLTGQVQGLVLPSVASGWVRITTAGTVTLTTAVAALTAGVCDIFVFYFTGAA